MIKVKDVAFVRFSAPDLSAMEKFAADFGLITTHGTAERLYLRGTDASPYIHVTELGEPRFIGAGFEAASFEDLEVAATLEGASRVEPIDGPGAGSCVRFTDPNGFEIDITHGRKEVDAIKVRHASPLNRGSERVRFRELQRISAGPAQVKRLGHVVLRVKSFQESREWYASRFGFLDSDCGYLGEKENLFMSFMRCDRGDIPVDHHTLLCIGSGEAGFDHAAFEVEDFDDLMAGHDHLAKRDYEHHAGVGRHVLGSQIFDYWKDPWGNVCEHFTDGDLLDSSAAPGLADPAVILGTQWGRFAPA